MLYSKLYLNSKEKAIILKWIDQGAAWKEHWSFIKPVLPRVPENIFVNSKIINPIDYFINRKLNEKNLEFSEKADKQRLLRRVSMDLTGLPPSIDEIEKLFAMYFDNLEPNAAPRVPPNEINPKYCLALFSRNKLMDTTQKIATTKKL